MSTKKMNNESEIQDENIDNTVVDNETQNSDDNNAEQSENKEELDPIASLEKQLAEQKDQNLRLYAEFENFRRRTAKEKIEMMATASEGLMTALLPVVDDFDRALKNLKEIKAHQQVTEGIELIQSKFVKTLENKGLTLMECSNNKDFDADQMEAITKIPAPNPKMAGKVIEEIEKGYKLGGKILRFPKVVVAEKA